jgi:hypothetical protein
MRYFCVPSRGRRGVLLCACVCIVLFASGWTHALATADQPGLRDAGHAVGVLAPNLDKASAKSYGPDFGPLHTYSETLQKLDELHAAYPSLTTARDSIGTTWDGHAIWLIEVSSNPGVEEGKPQVLFDGLHHSSEPMGTETCLTLIEYLCQNYDTDPYVRHLVGVRTRGLAI